MDEVIIKLKRCTLILPENDLFKLPEDVLKKAIGRGKGYNRVLINERRQAGVDRWQVYNWLKGHSVPKNVADLIESMGTKELREGCTEYLLMKTRTGQTDNN